MDTMTPMNRLTSTNEVRDTNCASHTRSHVSKLSSVGVVAVSLTLNSHQDKEDRVFRRRIAGGLLSQRRRVHARVHHVQKALPSAQSLTREERPCHVTPPLPLPPFSLAPLWTRPGRASRHSRRCCRMRTAGSPTPAEQGGHARLQTRPRTRFYRPQLREGEGCRGLGACLAALSLPLTPCTFPVLPHPRQSNGGEDL